MIMARSPISSTFQRRPSAHSMYSEISVQSVKSVNVRRPSGNQLDRFAEAPQVSPVEKMAAHLRSPSISSTQADAYETSPPLTRKVSSGITKRIQALAEDTTSRPHDPRELSPELAVRDSSPSGRRAAMRSPPMSRPASYRSASRLTRRTSSTTSDYSPQQPDVSSPWSVTPIWNVQHDSSSNRESVSVRARIVRPVDAKAEGEDGVGSDVPLQSSQLFVHHRRGSSQATVKAMQQPRVSAGSRNLSETSDPALHNLSQAQAQPVPEFRSMHSSRKSFGRSRAQPSPTMDDFPSPPMPMHTQPYDTASSLIQPQYDEPAAPKESSRASRFFKRMSNLGGGKDSKRQSQQSSGGLFNRSGSNGDLTSLPPATTVPNSHHLPDKSDMPPAVLVGDLNVQFPDSLVSCDLCLYSICAVLT